MTGGSAASRASRRPPSGNVDSFGSSSQSASNQMSGWPEEERAGASADEVELLSVAPLRVAAMP